MFVRWLLATLHLFALGIGLGAIWVRARTFGGTLDSAGYRRLFAADTVWGLAGVLWLVTGLLRAFGGYEKGSAYYLANHAFWGKMALLTVVLLLEIWPMVTLIRWRRARGGGAAVKTRRARTFARISYLQALLVVVMIGLAVLVARSAPGASQG